MPDNNKIDARARLLANLPGVKARRQMESGLTRQLPPAPETPPRLIAGPAGSGGEVVVVQAAELAVTTGATPINAPLSAAEFRELVRDVTTIQETRRELIALRVAEALREGRDLATLDEDGRPLTGPEVALAKQVLNVAISVAQTAGGALKQAGSALSNFVDEHPWVLDLALAAMQGAAEGAMHGAYCGTHIHQTNIQTTIRTGPGSKIFVNQGDMKNTNIKF